MATTTHPARKHSNAVKATRSLVKEILKTVKMDTVVALVTKIIEEKTANNWT